MLIRILFVILFFVCGYYVIRSLLALVASGRCPDCEGQGFWRGTRGDKNTCSSCDGTGRLPEN